ncbi:MAG: CopG family antitoxin [Chloroflexota bacterium]
MTEIQKEASRITRQYQSRIPSFKTVEEEAAFWDTHSSVEFEDELEVVTDVIFVKARPRKRGLTVRLDEDTLTRLAQQAQEKGVGPSTLARMWILERLRRSENDVAGMKGGA